MTEILSASPEDGGQRASPKGAQSDGRGTTPDSWQHLSSSIPSSATHRVTPSVTDRADVTNNAVDPVTAAVRAHKASSLETPEPRHDDGYPAGVPAAVADAFEALAMKAVAKGRKRYSARSLCELLRWHSMVESGGKYKLNNNMTRPLAEWFLAKHPELPGFFELREHGTLDEVV